eukprot:3593594-Rhodomonas_salina.1
MHFSHSSALVYTKWGRSPKQFGARAEMMLRVSISPVSGTFPERSSTSLDSPVWSRMNSRADCL